jgi:hypothetical protein
MADKNIYFANLEPRDLVTELMAKVEGYYDFISTTGRLNVWKRTYEYYYRGIFRGARVIKTGANQEFFTIHANHFRNLLTHLLTMTTSQRPSFEPRATNTDYRSMAQVIDATGILDYYMREKMMENVVKEAIETTLVFGEADVSAEWDPMLGDDYGVNPETQRKVKQGDISFSVFSPLDVVRDPLLPKASEATWKIIRVYRNKFDLAARFPNMRDKILGLSMDKSRRFNERIIPWSTVDTDLIPVWRFFHDKTEAVPDGRIMEFLDSDVFTLEGGLPYKRMPLNRAAASEQAFTPFGYTIGYDLLPIQEAIDGLLSTILTNQANFGVQNILIPNGANIGVTQLAGGLNVISYDPKNGPPQALNLTSTPPELFNFLSMLERLGEMLSGVNSVTRGDPEKNLKSGAALALVQSMAIQFASGLQQTYAQLVENLGTSVVELLQQFANTPRMAAIAGKSKRSYMLEFSGKDLANINRVQVDMGNPLTRTTAGKVQIAQDLLQAGQANADQYIQVLNTGRLEPMFEGKQAELMLVRAENEKLMEGTPVQAIATDTHPLHIMEHKSVVASPEARENPQIIQSTLTHIQEHIRLLRETDPGLLAVLGMTPIPQATPPVPTGPEPGGSAPASGGSAAEVLNPAPPAMQEAAGVNMPQMPKNPATGQRFNPVTGGM